MITKAVRPEFKNNPLYPLPKDYGDLNAESQRKARVNAVSLQETPADMVYSWMAFRQYYLLPTTPGFFYKRYKPSPKFHYQLLHDMGKYPYNAIAAPRGSSKSTVLAVECPLLLSLTRPNFNTLLVLSKEDMVSKRMRTQIMRQLEFNEFILRDFGVEFKKQYNLDSNIVLPAKGSSKGSRSVHLCQLPNGAMIQAASVKGGLLGERPDIIFIDDPEVDSKLNKVSEDLVNNFDQMLHNHILPMLDEGASVFWIGTLLSLRCFLYYVMTCKNDGRFDFWNRRLLDAEDDGKGGLLWPEKWSQEFLNQEKKKLGMAAYNAQRRNRPGKGDSTVFDIHPELTGYQIVGELSLASPLIDDHTVLRSWKGTKQEAIQDKLELVERPFGSTVRKMTRVLAMDWAQCLTPSSDYIAMMVIGIESSSDYKNVWWVLDLDVGRYPGHMWVPRFWAMAQKWKVTYAGVEAVAAQSTLVNTLQEYKDRMGETEGWMPRPAPIKYPSQMSKEDRIGQLQWRFPDKIKLPHYIKDTWPWRQLFEELESFTGLPGATAKDDASDTLAMFQFLLKGQVRRIVDDGLNDKGQINPYECVMKGDLDIDGIQPGLGLLPHEIDQDMVTQLVLGKYEEELEDREMNKCHRQEVYQSKIRVMSGR